MTVFTALSAFNLIATFIVMVVASVRFHQSSHHNTRQILITPVFLAFGLALLHIYSMTLINENVRDLLSLVWRLIDLFTLIVILRLIKAIPHE